MSIGADYKHFRNTINQNDATALVTPITYMNLSAEYDGFWRTGRFSTTLSLSADAGPRGLVNNSTTFANDRYKGEANYFYLRWDLATVIKLPADFNLRLRVAGQGATEPLITNEDYSIAGADGVRGYLEAEELGDKAVKGTIQLTSPGWRHGAHVFGDVYGFYDAATMTVIDPLAGEPAGITLRSWGLRLRPAARREIDGIGGLGQGLGHGQRHQGGFFAGVVPAARNLLIPLRQDNVTLLG